MNRRATSPTGSQGTVSHLSSTCDCDETSTKAKAIIALDLLSCHRKVKFVLAAMLGTKRACSHLDSSWSSL
jgi:hypothetical protein